MSALMTLPSILDTGVARIGPLKLPNPYIFLVLLQEPARPLRTGSLGNSPPGSVTFANHSLLALLARLACKFTHAMTERG